MNQMRWLATTVDNQIERVGGSTLAGTAHTMQRLGHGHEPLV
jgi:hypothetical protein